MTEIQPIAIAPTSGRTRPLRAMVLCLLAGVVVTTVPFAEHAALYAIVLGLGICVVVPLWYRWFRGELDFFESVHIFGLVYFVYFGLGAIWTVNDPSYVAYDLYIVPYVPRAALYCLFGYLTFLAGYFCFWRQPRRNGARTERVTGPGLLLIVGCLGIVGYAATSVLERVITLGGSVGVYGTLAQLSPFFQFAWALGWLLFFSGQGGRSNRLVLFGFLVPGAAITASATFSDKSLLMVLIGIPIIALWYVKRRIPWVFLLVLLLVLVFVIFPFYNTYRWSDPTMGQVNRMMVTYETIQNWDADRYLQFSVRSFTRRLAMINSVAVVLRDVGRWTPYAQGSTIFMPTVVYFIPRVIWPDKPITMLGRDFGRIFRVTNTFTGSTYVGATVPGELYWNFDLPGILVGMAILGVGVRFLYRRYGEAGTESPVLLATHIMLLVQVAHLGSSLAAAFVLIVRTLVLLELLRWFCRRFHMIEPVERPVPAEAETATVRP